MSYKGFSFSRIFNPKEWAKFISALTAGFKEVETDITAVNTTLTALQATVTALQASNKLAKAWANFDGTAVGTNAPAVGLGVTSITRTGAGLWTVNLSITLPANYSVVVTGGNTGAAVESMFSVYSYGTTSFKIAGFNSADSAADFSNINFQVFSN